MVYVVAKIAGAAVAEPREGWRALIGVGVTVALTGQKS